MAQYTAKELRNISKAELVDLLTKEGIEFDKTMPYFTLRALLLNETKNDDSMGKKKQTAVAETEPVEKIEEVAETPSEQPVEKIEEVAETPTAQPEKVEQPKTEIKQAGKPKNVDSLKALRSEIVKRNGGVGLGKSAFAAELAKRRGERVTGVTFAQELKSRQLKYGK